MTTLAHVEYTCPVCTHQFQSQIVVSTSGYGGKRTDFQERTSGRQPLPYSVHTCWKCGFTAPDAVFECPDPGIDPLVVDQLLEVMPAFRGRQLTGSEKFEAAARAAWIMGEDDRVLGDFYLKAAWCCVDEADTEAERYFRGKAAERFDAALATYDGVESHERAVITYLTGELYRRMGHVQRAVEWFRKVPNEIVDATTQQWIIDAAIQQSVAPREWWSITSDGR
jgi:uncharacterized protein (DUF2225 family)